MDNSTNQTTEDDIANTQIRSSRETSPRINREQERFRGLLHELSTPIKGRLPKLMMRMKALRVQSRKI